MRIHILRFLSFAIISIAFILQSCAKPTGDVGSSVGWQLSDDVSTDTLQVSVDTTFFVPRISTSGSQFVYVGNAMDIESRGLISFGPRRLADRWRFDWTKQPRVQISYSGGFGTHSNFELIVSQLQQKWDAASPPLHDSLMNYDYLANVSGSASPDSIGNFSFHLQVEKVQRWFAYADSIRLDTLKLDTANVDTNFNLLIDADAAMDWMIRLRSRQVNADSLKPLIYFYVMRPDTADTNVFHADSVYITASKNAWLVKDSRPMPNDRLVIGSGVVYETDLKFNFTDFYARVGSNPIVINRAVLTLHYDLTQFPNMPLTNAIMPFKLLDNSWLTDPLNAPEAGIFVVSVPVDTALGKFEFVLNTVSSEWASGVDKNYGIALRSAGEGFNIDRIAFHTSEDPDLSKRPTLRLHYTELK